MAFRMHGSSFGNLPRRVMEFSRQVVHGPQQHIQLSSESQAPRRQHQIDCALPRRLPPRDRPPEKRRIQRSHPRRMRRFPRLHHHRFQQVRQLIGEAVHQAGRRAHLLPRPHQRSRTSQRKRFAHRDAEHRVSRFQRRHRSRKSPLLVLRQSGEPFLAYGTGTFGIALRAQMPTASRTERIIPEPRLRPAS